MSTPRIRRARPGDADGILALEVLFPGDRMSRRSVRRFLSLPACQAWVVEHGGRVAGSLLLLQRRNSGWGRIYSVVVDPALRGQGLGERLVRTAERQARADGLAGLSLEVRQDNAAARRLYARLGYTELLSLPGYYEDGAPGIRLRKPFVRPTRRP
jgi:ribosomal protein S18 acetylase RimI-like enzyme